MLTVAAAPLRIPKALTIGCGMRSAGWLMLKLVRDLSVWAPQYLSAGTWTSPKASVSALVSAILYVDAVKFLWVMMLAVIALGAKAKECCADLEVKLERAREGYETFIHAEVTRPAAPEVALAERDASIVTVCAVQLFSREKG